MSRITFLLLLLGLGAHAQPQIKWPHHKKAVIVLTYDDGLKSQLDNAVPLLDSLHFKGTFFLIGDALDYNTIPQWRAVAKKGHELANHTMYHPCTDKNNPVGSQSYTPATILREIGTTNYFLFALDGKTTHSYAYPCTETSVGGKYYVDSLRKSGAVSYARIGGDKDDAVITDFKKLDPLLVPSYGVEAGTTGEQLIAFVKKVEQSGGMGVFMFHGIGGDWIITSPEAHKQLLEYLAHDKDIWVATFSEAMDYARQATQLK
ncbi:MAG TPA: polysaccharide deacetylase family protein [Mucilaginibacter sp.]|jgi:peptidoglycan/xylan/chitin deacetylase (PgdA/CDA1 family)|nr:polysaccharide deacetylase family protein [Mucilaginibacter sp.]